MTREEYKPIEWDFTLGNGYDYTLSSKVDDIVDAIFDDFERKIDELHFFYQRQNEEHNELHLEDERLLHQANTLNAKLNRIAKSRGIEIEEQNKKIESLTETIRKFND